MPREVGRDLIRGIEERNLKACSNIVAEIRCSQTTVFLADQLGLQELERRLELGEFQSAEQLAGMFRVQVGRAYREGELDCNHISEAHHYFEVEFANRVHAWEEEEEGDDVPEEEEEEKEMEEDLLEEDELEHQRLLSLLSMSRRIERELGSLRMERRWSHSEEKRRQWNQSEEEPDEGAFSDVPIAMEEEGVMSENYSRGSTSNHFVKSFWNIETYNNQLHAEL